MNIFRPLILLILLLAPCAAFAQNINEPTPQIYFDRSDSDVPLNITFNGQDILIYGAVENLGGLDPDIIIKITGPLDNYVIHKKSHRLGMWINTQSLTFRRVPSFLALFSDAPLDTIILPTEKIRHDIGFERSLPLRGFSAEIDEPEAFLNAFINLQKRKQKYVLDEDGVKIAGNILFSAHIPLAADIIEGTYTVEILLLGRGRVLASVTSDLPVYKSGIERWLFELSQNQGWLYGLLAIFMAVLVAYLMSQFMRLFQR